MVAVGLLVRRAILQSGLVGDAPEAGKVPDQASPDEHNQTAAEKPRRELKRAATSRLRNDQSSLIDVGSISPTTSSLNDDQLELDELRSVYPATLNLKDIQYRPNTNSVEEESLTSARTNGSTRSGPVNAGPRLNGRKKVKPRKSGVPGRAYRRCN